MKSSRHLPQAQVEGSCHSNDLDKSMDEAGFGGISKTKFPDIPNLRWL